jgi:hypothetical protein
MDIEKYVNISSKLVQLQQLRLHNLESALVVLSERITFLTNQNEHNKVKDAYIEMIRVINSEAQTKDISEKHYMILCGALEQVTKYKLFCTAKETASRIGEGDLLSANGGDPNA